MARAAPSVSAAAISGSARSAFNNWISRNFCTRRLRQIAFAMLRTASSSLAPAGIHSSTKADRSSSNSFGSSPGTIAVLENTPCFCALGYLNSWLRMNATANGAVDGSYRGDEHGQDQKVERSTLTTAAMFPCRIKLASFCTTPLSAPPISGPTRSRLAGEDDLDAPDLATPTQQTSEPEKPRGDRNGRLNGGQHNPAPGAVVRRDGKLRSPAEAMLGPEPSAELRDRLLAELNNLSCGDDAALWAHRCLPEKNRLTGADAQRVEEAYCPNALCLGRKK